MNFKFTRISKNSKTGPIPTTVSSSDTCPDNCGLKKNGCYADYGMVGMHWRNTDKGKHVITWSELNASIKALPMGQLWRHNVAGDLPQNSAGYIDDLMLGQLTVSNKGKRGFTYSHHAVLGDTAQSTHNRSIIAGANAQGFTVNLSADTLADADSLAALNIGPVVCVLPEDAPKMLQTPQGRLIVQCPAVYRDDIDCARCGICAVTTRKAIVGFPVHGAGKRKAETVHLKGIAIIKG